MLGYLAVDQVGDAYVGGVLVVDDLGLPLEFRHTLPVRPTRLQRTLYGGTLDRYLRSVVIGRRLVEELEHPPPVVIADDPSILIDAEPPIAVLAEGGAEPIGTAGAVVPLEGAQPGFLVQVRPGEAPLRVLTVAAAHLHADLAALIVRTAETMDVHEPLDRVRHAIGLVAREAADAA